MCGKVLRGTCYSTALSLEISCDKQMPALQARMNPEAAPFHPRRDAAVAGSLRLQDITQ